MQALPRSRGAVRDSVDREGHNTNVGKLGSSLHARHNADPCMAHSNHLLFVLIVDGYREMLAPSPSRFSGSGHPFVLLLPTVPSPQRHYSNV